MRCWDIVTQQTKDCALKVNKSFVCRPKIKEPKELSVVFQSTVAMLLVFEWAASIETRL